jgi:hypothetical protein
MAELALSNNKLIISQLWFYLNFNGKFEFHFSKIKKAVLYKLKEIKLDFLDLVSSRTRDHFDYNI